MNRILQLQQDKAAALDAAEAIRKKAETDNRVLTPEERAAFEQHAHTAEEIAATLTIEQRAATLSNTHTDQTHGRTEVHNNELDRPYGPEARTGESEKERRSRLWLGFGEQLQSIQKHATWQSSGAIGKPPDERLLEIQRRSVPAGASEAVPADGGFLIQPDFANEVLRITHDTGLVYTRARMLPLSEATNAIKIPAVDEQSRVDGSRWGGVRLFWENEADALTGSKPKFRNLELVTKKLTGLFYSTNELLADAAALGAIATQAFGEELGFKLDAGCISGTGSGQLMGILNAPCLVTVAKETGQASTTIVYENIKKMWGRMWARSRANAVWFVNQDTEQQLFGLSQVVGTAGLPVYVPPGGASAAPYGTLFGRPVIAIEQCSTLGTSGDILLTDFSQYIMVDKGTMQSAVSMHVRFLTDEMTYRYIYRVDGQPIWATALTPFNGTNTLSPFIALAAR